MLRFNRKFLTYRETDRSFHLVKQKQNFFSRLPLPKLGLPTGDLRSPIANACRTRHSISRNTYSVQRRRRVGYVFPTVSRPPLSRIDDGERVGASKTFNDLDNRVHAVSSIFSSNTQTASEWLELDKSSSQTNAIVCFEGRIIPFLWWFGLIKSRRYLDYESPSLTEVTPQSGFMVGVAMTTHWCLAVRLELVMYFLMRLKGPSFNLSVNYSLKLPRVVPSNAESFKLVSHGDIKTMKVKLTAGEVSPFDVLSNGTSLLHVSNSSLYLRQTFR